MEVIEINTRKRQNQLACPKPSTDCPCNVKCTKRYVQPSRLKSFAPEKTYSPPSKVFEANTTYHLSYLTLDNAEMRRSRSQPIKPTPALHKSDGKFADETTSRLSYKPNEKVCRVKPILPRQRTLIGTGKMECVTTVRHDFARKHGEKPEIILPCGNIRLSSGRVDGSTTAKISYPDPGPAEPTMNFKPLTVYCPPSEPILDDTTQKLSYQPVCIQEAEVHPWQRKPIYKPPDVAMFSKTTYSESFLKNQETAMEKPIRPPASSVLPQDGEFSEGTVYKDSYLESGCVDRVEAIMPRNNIPRADGKISNDTTNKMSYQPLQSEKRAPILPRSRNMIGDGSMQSETTSRCDFAPKSAPRSEPIIPCSNLRNADSPMDDKTTTKLSYAKPGLVECVQSFKPAVQYCRLPDKIDADTVTKLSYQAWTPPPKEAIPWATRTTYAPPSDPMCADTCYRVSYPLPGHYEEACVPDDCHCLNAEAACADSSAQPQTNVIQ